MSDALTDRERFLALCYNGPLLSGDCIVVLAGEDAQPRAEVAAGLFTRGAAPALLVTGLPARDAHRDSADETVVRLLALGVAPERITVDGRALHTRHQAERVVAEARAREWKRLLLVASAYHIPRAVLTFVAAMRDAGHELHLIPVGASHASWLKCPEGMTDTRLDLLGVELAKCETYAEKGDCATFAEGVAYVARVEGA